MGRKARERAARKAAVRPSGQRDALLLPEVIHKLYDSALTSLFDQVTNEPSRTEPVIGMFIDLARFYRDHVCWAELRPDDSIHSLEAGQSVHAWMVAMSPGSSRARQQRQVLQADWFDGSYGLFIRPAPVTSRWAGLLAVHEIEHLASMASGRETRGQRRDPYLEGEVRAYSVERAAADILTGGHYSHAVNRALADHGLTTIESVVRLNGTRVLDQITGKLDGVITVEEAVSTGEARLRGGLHLIAFGFALIDRIDIPSAESLKRKKAFIESLYLPLGVLPLR